MSNTRIVAVNDRITHKRYKKVITRTRRYAVHDPESLSFIGDQVQIRETKPLSKTKKLGSTKRSKKIINIIKK